MMEFTTPKQGRKHRVHQWINTDTMTPMYGVQCNVLYGKWVHVALDGEICLFLTRDRASDSAKVWSAVA